MKITILNGAQKGQVFDLINLPFFIGRDTQNSIVLNDFKVSRKHLKITKEQDTYLIVDLESANGTFLNNHNITQSSLSHGDTILLGSTLLGIQIDPLPPVFDEKDLEQEIQLAQDSQIKIELSVPCQKTILQLKKQFENNPDRLFSNLSTLFHVSEMIHRILDEKELLKKISDLLFEVVGGDRLTILIPNKNSEWTPLLMHRKNIQGRFYPLAVSQSIIQQVTHQKMGVLIKDTALDGMTSSQESILTLGIKSAMCAPLIIQDNITGLIYTDVIHSAKFFDEYDLQLLMTLINQSTVAIDNCRLYQELKEQDKMKNELKIAHDIQIHLLPDSHPNLKNIDLVFKSKSAEEIGGDYIDWFWLNKHELSIVIADVSGKGIPGALIMAMFKAYIRSQANTKLQPSLLLRNINQLLHQSMRLEMFVTAIYGIFDINTHEFTFCRAGHLPLIHFNKDASEVHLYEPKGMALGMLQWNHQIQLEEKTISLNQNDTLVFYTDGLEEAINPQGNELGRDRLISMIEKDYQLPLIDLQDHVYQSILNFTQNKSQFDDMTLCMLRRL